MFGFGKKKSEKGGSSKLDRYNEQKDNEAAWGFLGSAKEESDRQAKRGGRWVRERTPLVTSLLSQTAKDAVTNQPSAKDWGREAIRLVVEDGASVEGVINQTKDALAWHRMNGLLDTDAKRAKFNNYFSTLRYLASGWASGAIPIRERDDVLRGEASFLSLYARQKRLEKEEAISFEEAVERLTQVRVFAQNASPTVALRLKQEATHLLDLLDSKLPGAPSD